MSDQTFAPGAVSNNEPAEAAEEVSSGRSYKTWIVAAAVGLVVAVAAYFLFFSGGSSDPAADDQGGLVTKPVASTAPSTVVKSSASAAATVLPVTQVGTSGRDPFIPLIVAAVTTAPAASATPSPTVVTTSPSAGTGVPNTGVPNVLGVTSVDAKAGVVAATVNGKAYSAVLGATFAKYFKLIAVGPSATCAAFQYGDSTVSLCKGQSITLTG